MYSDTVRRLLNELQYRGPLSSATHSARCTNPVCGDITEIHLRVRDGSIHACRFQSQGCAAAIASAAAVPYLIEGGTVQQALALSVEDLLGFLGGLPSHKGHGAELAIETLRIALTRIPRRAR